MLKTKYRVGELIWYPGYYYIEYKPWYSPFWFYENEYYVMTLDQAKERLKELNDKSSTK